jgi:putative Mg2+ transporter-C (MgtC) family protein
MMVMPESNWVSLTARLLLALIAGGVIGWNRQTHGKPAGFRTHMLVSLGAALFVMVPVETSAPDTDAVSRAIQGIATGVGFIGAGEIIHDARPSAGSPWIKGLTSAAALWVTAALGIAAACGLWQVCLVGTLLTLMVLVGAKWVERWIPVGRDES